MNEQEWLHGDRLDKMLWWIEERVSDRKLRLFACACCRALVEPTTPRSIFPAIDVAERYADGLASEVERMKAWLETENRKLIWREAGLAGNALAIAHLAADALAGPHQVGAQLRCGLTYRSGNQHDRRDARPIGQRLLREVVGNPFATVPRKVIAALQRDDTVRAIAGVIYQEQRFRDMPILGDALQDAGCDNEAILMHCRQPEAVHVRGCWVLDLLRSVG